MDDEKKTALEEVSHICFNDQLAMLSAYIHILARQWWPDGPPDEDDVTWKAARIALMHSELSECLEGVRKGVMDDHLQDRPMEHVELADTLIRIFDYCGRYGIPIDNIVSEKLHYNAKRADHKLEHRQAEGGKKI